MWSPLVGTVRGPINKKTLADPIFHGWRVSLQKKFVLVALLGCETQVINIVVSCNCLLLLITSHSQNISRLFIAAGNIISSSADNSSVDAGRRVKFN